MQSRVVIYLLIPQWGPHEDQDLPTGLDYQSISIGSCVGFVAVEKNAESLLHITGTVGHNGACLVEFVHDVIKLFSNALPRVVQHTSRCDFGSLDVKQWTVIIKKECE